MFRLFKRKAAPPASVPAAPAANDPARTHSGFDWADASLGPNHALSPGERHRADERVRVRPRIVLDAHVAQRFNAYALAAHPREIGGLARMKTEVDSTLRIVDVRIFAHVAASGGYFELDGEDVARFNLSLLASGRKDEIPEWKCLVHSHPNMTPFLSGTDRTNVVRLAGPGHAFSLIVATSGRPEDNYHAMHYAQGGPVPLVLTRLAVEADPGQSLSGLDLLTDTERETIRDEVAEALAHTRRGFGF